MAPGPGAVWGVTRVEQDPVPPDARGGGADVAAGFFGITCTCITNPVDVRVDWRSVPARPQTLAEEALRRKGAQPIRSTDDLACDGVFETDEEL